MMKESSDTLILSQGALESFSEDVEYLWCTQKQIPVLEQPPSPLTFLRDSVSVSRPCIIRNAVFREESEPLKLVLEVLVAMDPDLELTVDVTPDGHGDCLRQVQSSNSTPKRLFVQPEQQKMTLKEFQTRLRIARKYERELATSRESGPKDRIFQSKTVVDSTASIDQTQTTQDAVLYYSLQNDCLRAELSSLWEKNIFPLTFAWAEEAFGVGPPDAVNLWMGDQRAVSSMHKDHYENLFSILSGEKVFTLCPPADTAFLDERDCESGIFDPSSGEWKVVEHLQEDGSPQTGQWIAANVQAKDDPVVLEEFPLLKYTHPIEVRVRAGELLYLPAL